MAAMEKQQRMKVLFVVQDEDTGIVGWCKGDESGLLVEGENDEASWFARNERLERRPVQNRYLDEVFRRFGDRDRLGLVLQPKFDPPYKLLSSHGARFAIVGSFLAIAGELALPDDPMASVSQFSTTTKRFAYMDLKRPKRGWKTNKEFASPRVYPKMVVAGGKLYVFGNGLSKGFYSEDSWGWPIAEVFDSNTKELAPIPPSPPPYFDDDDYFDFPARDVAAFGDKTILTFAVPEHLGPSKVYSYDIATASWSSDLSDTTPVFPRDFPSYVNSTNLVTVGHTVYWFSPLTMQVFAFDATPDATCSCSDPHHLIASLPIVLGRPRLNKAAFCASLHSVSPDIFCLVWRDYFLPSNPLPPWGGSHRFCVTKLHISRVMECGCPKSLSVSIKYNHTYILPYPVNVLYAGLMSS